MKEVKSVLKFLGRNSGFEDNNNSAYFEYESKLFFIDCGITVFQTVKNKFDFSKYDDINIIITHLHQDHAGSLGQLILYLGYKQKKIVNIVTKCKHIRTYLNIIGVDPKLYTLNQLSNLNFIKTKHVKFLDAYGFKAKFGNKTILYTGDTNTLEPFEKSLKDVDEFYVDVSKYGEVHLKIDDVIDKLILLEKSGIKIFLMHLDDEKYIESIVKDRLNFVKLD